MAMNEPSKIYSDIEREDNHHLLRVRLHKPIMAKLKNLAQEASQEQQEYISVSDLVRAAIGSFIQVQDTKKRLGVLVNPRINPKVRKD
jgi:hypothetical protein